MPDESTRIFLVVSSRVRSSEVEFVMVILVEGNIFTGMPNWKITLRSTLSSLLLHVSLKSSITL